MLLALLEEYQRATIDLKKILSNLSEEDFTIVRDSDTPDPDCVSIQSIMLHVVGSGHSYANYVKEVYGGQRKDYEGEINTPLVAIQEIDGMLSYTEECLEPIWSKTNDEINSWSIQSRWGPVFTFEQLMEHAIVHILRHRRQIENFLRPPS